MGVRCVRHGGRRVGVGVGVVGGEGSGGCRCPCRLLGGGSESGCRQGIFSLSRDLAFDMFEGITSVCMEIWVTECPTLRRTVISKEQRNETEGKAYMLAELVIIHILDFMKIIFVQLPHKTRKVGVLEHAW